APASELGANDNQPPPPAPDEEGPGAGRGRTVVVVVWVVGAAASLLLLLGLTLFLRPSVPPPPPDRSDGGDTNSPLHEARKSLMDVGNPGGPVTGMNAQRNACREALQQLNAYLAQAGAVAVPELTAAEAKKLQEAAGLSGEELAEVRSTTFTSLD